ncbi:MAG: prolyl oligopeptidase family serine peptidase [Prosthecobacter sp.]|jgi:acetyl esterase/lipase|uniref:prolyl oligopeptidase family serine peptidase n=1 Tax=Prosthecobacter sp. TaxID=1965333 RepID=UPI0019E90E06|nr:prolyl oligopeptidase family serine peptidase [Prosthecobacter sp.]MBE2282675.1 prolyl oligopeptidase family serine peptidase [Prosthecobacter sp.]
MKSAFVFLVLAVSALAQNAGVKSHRDLVYVEGGHERHKLDLHLPEKAGEPLPLLIWVHGGGWQAGSKDGCPPLRSGYVERGYAVASINYRLSGHATFPAQIEDCKAAIRWLRAHAKDYGLDPKRFGVWGSSAGGHLVALIGTSGDVKEFDVGANLDQSSRVQSVCDFYGPSDLTVFVTTPGYESHATDSSPEAKLLGGTVMQNKDKAARVNPITYASKDDPPFLIVHGDKDPTVPINQSQLLFEALKKTGASARFHTIHGAGHGGPGFAGQDMDAMVAAFFDERLKKASDKVEALSTESTADPAMTARDPRKGMPQPGAARRAGIPWQAITGRDDKNQDGKVSREEFSGPATLFQRLDKNGDGMLTRDEHEAFQTPPPQTSAPNKASAAMTGFQLDGERWTYRDGDFTMDGIFMKPEGKGPFPAVLISHGMGGNAQGFGGMKAREMVQWGMVCIAPNYTHAGIAGDRAQFGASAENLRRAKTCLDILRSMPEVDGTRIAAYGHSMGGFVTIGLAATEPGLLKAAAITGSGISSQEGYAAPSTKAAERIRTPFLMLHGANDTTVRPEQSASLKQVLDGNQVPNDRLIADGQGHPIDQTMRDEVFRLVREWFRKQGVLQR